MKILASSSFRRGVVIALLAWAPGALLAHLSYLAFEGATLEVLEGRVVDLEEELYGQYLEWRGEEWDDEGDEGDEESEESEESELEGAAGLGRLSSSDLLGLLEDGEEIEELDACLRLESRGGEVQDGDRDESLGANFDAVLEEYHLRGEWHRLLITFDTDEHVWCLARDLELADGTVLWVGTHWEESWQILARGRLYRAIVLWSGLPLALLLAWLHALPMRRFGRTVAAVEEQQSRGEAGARLRTRELDRDLRGLALALNRTYDHLEKAVRALSQIGDSIAHDLRTPLARLQGQLDLLKRHPDPKGDLIDAVQAEADQILATFNALLRIAQIESGQKKGGFKKFDLGPVVADVAELYAPVFVEKSVTFTWRAESGQADSGQAERGRTQSGRFEAYGDRDLWLQALSNLVENALKYTPAGGHVELSLSKLGSRVRLRLQDSGPGIPEGERENVFLRFYRLERHRGERGNGLGLSLVAAVCELHGATIRLAGGESGGPKGLRVDVLL